MESAFLEFRRLVSQALKVHASAVEKLMILLGLYGLHSFDIMPRLVLETLQVMPVLIYAQNKLCLPCWRRALRQFWRLFTQLLHLGGSVDGWMMFCILVRFWLEVLWRTHHDLSALLLLNFTGLDLDVAYVLVKVGWLWEFVF